MIVREPVEADADAMGALHVRAWQAAYRGVMPDEYLDGLRVQDRADLWRRSIAEGSLQQGRGRLLVAEHGGQVQGFAAFGPEAGGDPAEHVGELYALNVDPPAWGRGLGRALVRAVTDELLAARFVSAVLWVVPENARARGLYESEGWTPDGAEKLDEVLGVEVREIRYRRVLP